MPLLYFDKVPLVEALEDYLEDISRVNTFHFVVNVNNVTYLIQEKDVNDFFQFLFVDLDLSFNATFDSNFYHQNDQK